MAGFLPVVSPSIPIGFAGLGLGSIPIGFGLRKCNVSRFAPLPVLVKICAIVFIFFAGLSASSSP